jgi:hypothetical protein
MAVSVVSFSQVSNWFSSPTSQTITSLAWTAGDVIVVVAGKENAFNPTDLSAPTNANLTFTSRASSTSGGSNECAIWCWTATAESSQTGQTITVADISTLSFGFGVWILSGASGSFANASANLTESAFTFTPTADSGVIYGFMDWNANTSNQTITTGTGTATERVDDGDGASYGQYLGDWMGVAASSTSFGVTSYSGTQVAHVVIEVLAAAAAATSSPIIHRPNYGALLQL